MGHAEEELLDTLYQCFGPAINRRARAILQDDQEASDVTQDTFLAYMRGQASLRGAASPFTVLYQIATHKAVDRLRRNSVGLAYWARSTSLRTRTPSTRERGPARTRAA